MAYSMSIRNICAPQDPRAWMCTDVPWLHQVDFRQDPRFRAIELAGDLDYYGVFDPQECLQWAHGYASRVQPSSDSNYPMHQRHYEALERLQNEACNVLVILHFWETGEGGI